MVLSQDLCFSLSAVVLVVNSLLLAIASAVSLCSRQFYCFIFNVWRRSCCIVFYVLFHSEVFENSGSQWLILLSGKKSSQMWQYESPVAWFLAMLHVILSEALNIVSFVTRHLKCLEIFIAAPLRCVVGMCSASQKTCW